MNDKTKVYNKVLSMAKEHDVSLEKSEEDLKREAFLKLSDNEIKPNKAMWAIVCMRRLKILNRKQGYELLSELIKEKKVNG